MAIWIIEPRDPLIVRDGRPFGPIPGARASSLAFPYPSTITGGVRTRAGLDSNGVFDAGLIPTVKRISVRGPLLVELNEVGEIETWLCPAPADALLLESQPPDEMKAVRKRLMPLEPYTGALTDLDIDLSLIGLCQPDPRKPHGKAPRFWYWSRYEEWLIKSHTDDSSVGPVMLSELGHDGPQLESRTHIRIQRETQTAVEGALFQTRGLEFTRVVEEPEEQARLYRRMALAIAVDDSPVAESIRHGVAPLGGERRLVNWLPALTQLPKCPDELRNSIIRQRHCRVLLLTPAHFQRGAHPTWLIAPYQGISPRLRSIAIGRPQVVSGWDFEHDRPKPTRRLAPAGTTFFLELNGEEESVNQWIDAMWMQCVSDDEQDRRDGFGLATLGAWDGSSLKME
jgi:CRISPR-associated protein Cmr3